MRPLAFSAAALVLILTSSLTALADESVPPAIESGWAPSISAGYGASYNAGGLGLELRRGHFAGFFALGADLFTAPPDSGPRGRGLGSLAIGGRWFSGEGEHLVLSVHASGASWDGWQTHSVGAQGHVMMGATAGWRQVLGKGFFAQVGVGAAAKYETYDVQLASAQPVSKWSLVPDVDAGVGLSF